LKVIRSFNYISSNTLSPVTYCYNLGVGYELDYPYIIVDDEREIKQ
jgi:hypothetical protein